MRPAFDPGPSPASTRKAQRESRDLSSDNADGYINKKFLVGILFITKGSWARNEEGMWKCEELLYKYNERSLRANKAKLSVTIFSPDKAYMDSLIKLCQREFLHGLIFLK